MRNMLRSNSCTKRHSAWMMVLVWLFTLAAGAANACVLEARASHNHGADTVYDEHDTDTQSTKQSCLKACDAGAQSLLKQPSSLDSPHLKPVPFAVTAWAANLHVSTLVARAHDWRLPEHGPPVRVLFSRLAV